MAKPVLSRFSSVLVWAANGKARVAANNAKKSFFITLLVEHEGWSGVRAAPYSDLRDGKHKDCKVAARWCPACARSCVPLATPRGRRVTLTVPRAQAGRRPLASGR